MKLKLNKKVICATFFLTGGVALGTLTLVNKNSQDDTGKLTEALDVIWLDQELNDCVVYELHFQDAETKEWKKLPNLFVGSIDEDYNTVLVDGVYEGMKKIPVGYIDNRFSKAEIIGSEPTRFYTTSEIDSYVFQKQEKNENGEWISTDSYLNFQNISINLENTEDSRWVFAEMSFNEIFSVPLLKQAYALSYDEIGNPTYQKTMRFTTIGNVDDSEYVWVDSKSYMLSEELQKELANSNSLLKK